MRRDATACIVHNRGRDTRTTENCVLSRGRSRDNIAATRQGNDRFSLPALPSKLVSFKTAMTTTSPFVCAPVSAKVQGFLIQKTVQTSLRRVGFIVV